MEGDAAGGHHFLVVVFTGQGHINPSIQLARKLTDLGHRATVSTTVFAHRLMFPGAANNPNSLPLDDPDNPLLSIYPHSDGHDDGFDWINGGDTHEYYFRMREVGVSSLGDVANSLAFMGRPVTCVIYGMNSGWSVSVARELGVKAVALWPQPATLMVACYHYFHGYKDAIDSLCKDTATGGQVMLKLPGLPPFRSRDIPSILGANTEFKGVFRLVFEEFFRLLDEPLSEGSLCKTRVLVNSVSSLEVDAFAAMEGILDVVPVGPLVPPVLLTMEGSVTKSEDEQRRPAIANFDMIKEKSDAYLGWLDSQHVEGSVIYVCFGSYGVTEERQTVELARALVEWGRPYLWKTRTDTVNSVNEALAAATSEIQEAPDGMVVEWCSQAKVLAHKSVGCLLTHCGWNSTIEALTAGIPLVAMPQWMDQPTNAKMVESVWQVGVRASASPGEGVVEASELIRCFNQVTGRGEEAAAMRTRATEWSTKIREAAAEGGPSERNLAEFVAGIVQP